MPHVCVWKFIFNSRFGIDELFLDKPKYFNLFDVSQNGASTGGVQDICPFQIGMKPQILHLRSHLGREAAQNAGQTEDLGFHANLE